MSPTTLLVVIFTIFITPTLAIIVAFTLKSYGKRRIPKFPPGQVGWPLVGSTFSFFKPHPPISRGDFIEQHLSRYGKIFSMSFFRETIVVSADPELNRFVLQNEMRLFKNSLPSHFRKLIGDFSMALLMGEPYRHKKSILLSFLGKSRLQTSFVKDVEEIAERLMSSWKNMDVIHAREETNRFSFNIIAKKAMSMSAGEPETEQLRRDFMTLYRGIHALPVNLPGTEHSKALKARANIVKFIKLKLEERKVEGNKYEEEDDLLNCLIKDASYTWENICDTLQGFIFAGQVTTSTALSLAMYFLQSSPKAIEQMREEHLQCIRSKRGGGVGKLAWDDYRNMEFTQNVISETLRLGNVVRNLWKKALKDVEFKGYLIPEGTTVITHLAAVHLDPSVFEKPDQFNPWRWLNATDSKKANNLLPFGGGVRHCMGSELARIEMSVFLHYLILNYNWEFVEPDHPIAFPQVIFPKDLPIRVQAL